MCPSSPSSSTSPMVSTSSYFSFCFCFSYGFYFSFRLPLALGSSVDPILNPILAVTLSLQSVDPTVVFPFGAKVRIKARRPELCCSRRFLVPLCCDNARQSPPYRHHSTPYKIPPRGCLLVGPTPREVSLQPLPPIISLKETDKSSMGWPKRQGAPIHVKPS